MSDPYEPTLIQPAKPPLSDGGGRRRFLAHKPARANAMRRITGFGAAMLILGAVAVFVFVYLPQRVEGPSTPSRSGQPTATGSPTRASPGDVVAPFEAADSARARTEAQAILADFFALETELRDELNVDAWGAEEFERIKERAAAGDKLFIEGRYRESVDEYALAVAELGTLADQGKASYESALAQGEAALARLDHDKAVAAFDEALTIRPEAGPAAAGRDRAAQLPQIIELLRQADRAVLRGEFAAAEGHLTKIRAINPATPGLARRAVALGEARADERRRSTLSAGFGALQRGDYGKALDAFNRVLEQNPDDPDGLAGVQQAKQAEMLAEIDRLRDVAESHESAGEWADALAAYDSVLAMDPSLRFARDGKSRIAARVALIDAIATYVDDPGLLSDDREFAGAQSVLARADRVADPGAQLKDQRERLRAIVKRSSTPVPLIIDSDNQTEVMIGKVGFIGTFLRNELLLRPGRYVIIGSRDGYRDVRAEIMLEPDAKPIEIRCTEAIGGAAGS